MWIVIPSAIVVVVGAALVRAVLMSEDGFEEVRQTVDQQTAEPLPPPPPTPKLILARERPGMDRIIWERGDDGEPLPNGEPSLNPKTGLYETCVHTDRLNKAVYRFKGRTAQEVRELISVGTQLFTPTSYAFKCNIYVEGGRLTSSWFADSGTARDY